MDNRLDETSKKRLDYYREYIGQFVTVTKKDGFVVAGILIDITPDNHIYIKGTYKESLFHFSEVHQFSARQDRHNGGGQN